MMTVQNFTVELVYLERAFAFDKKHNIKELLQAF